MAIERHTTEETADDLSRRYGAAYLPLLTITAVTAALTMMMSGTSIGVVVPDVMGAFGVGQDKAQLMGTAFYIAMTVSQLLSVWLGGLLGQRRAFSIALLLFAMASVVGATAEDFSLIVFARVVQGVGAGLIQTQTMLALFQAFPAERRGIAMGLYAAGMVLAIGIGPALGGVVVEAFGWRYIFLAPMPLVFCVFLAELFAMSTVRARASAGLRLARLRVTDCRFLLRHDRACERTTPGLVFKRDRRAFRHRNPIRRGVCVAPIVAIRAAPRFLPIFASPVLNFFLRRLCCRDGKFRIDLRRASLRPIGPKSDTARCGYVNAPGVAHRALRVATDRSVGGQHDTADRDCYRPPLICGRHVFAGGGGREYAVPARSSLRGHCASWHERQSALCYANRPRKLAGG